MPVNKCPKCGALTFHNSLRGRECSTCGYKMNLMVANGKGGKGNRCSNCGRFTVFNNKCTSCGATYGF